MSLDLLEVLLVAGFLAPAVASALLAVSWLLDAPLHESKVAKVAVVSTSLGAVSTTLGAFLGAALGRFPLEMGPFTWFSVADYHFALTFRWDSVSLVMLLCTTILTAFVTAFSVNALHRERGHFRFFFLILLFATAMEWLVVAGSFDQLLLGWELVGLTSILLVGFFNDRPQPGLASIRVLVTYRLCDLGLLVGSVLMHQTLHDTSFTGVSKHLTSGWVATSLGLAMLLAASGKAAQLPFGTWLPKAMEGPTPSSSLYYGGLSVHAGIYLLIRSTPLFEASWVASAAAVAVGTITTIVASLVARVQPDAKSALAWASMAQLGLMVVEVGLHLPKVALAHLVAHAAVRSVQLLKAPQLLHDSLTLRQSLGTQSLAFDGHEVALPRFRLLREALFLERLVERMVLTPLTALGRHFEHLEAAWAHRVSRLAPRSSAEPEVEPNRESTERVSP